MSRNRSLSIPLCPLTDHVSPLLRARSHPECERIPPLATRADRSETSRAASRQFHFESPKKFPRRPFALPRHEDWDRAGRCRQTHGTRRTAPQKSVCLARYRLASTCPPAKHQSLWRHSEELAEGPTVDLARSRATTGRTNLPHTTCELNSYEILSGNLTRDGQYNAAVSVKAICPRRLP